MVACANYSFVVNCRAIRNLCRLCNSTIYIYVILMKKFYFYFSSVGKFINKIVVNFLLTLVYALVILPYHIFMHRSNGKRWNVFNKTYSQSDFIHMG